VGQAHQTALSSVIVVSHNEGKSLRRTVGNLRNTVTAPAEIIVVDDISTDGSADNLGDDIVTVLRPKRRLGASEARNFGARYARGEILVFADGHIAAQRSWFPHFQNALSHSSIGVVGPAYVEMNWKDCKGFGLEICDAGLNWTWLERLSDSPYPVPMLGGFFLGVRREVFWEVGGFDPGFGIWGMEDMEFGFRVWAYGYECVLLPGVEVAHESRKPGAVPGYQTNWYSGLRNTLRVAVLHFNEHRMRRVFRFYANDSYLPAAMAALAASNAWQVRERIHIARKRDDDWLFERFKMHI
jgi:GT2 family glycosyltransferase